MPIIKINGAQHSLVEEYTKHLEEIAKTIIASPEKIVILNQSNESFPKVNGLSPIYVEVNWKARPDKQEWLAKHLYDFFKKSSTKVFVAFINIDDFIYLDGNKI